MSANEIKQGGRGRRTAIVFGSVVTLFGFLAFVVVFGLIQTRTAFEKTLETTVDIADRVIEAVGLEPTVVVNDRIIVQSQKEIAELAVEERQFVQTLSWEHSQFLSTKKLVIEGEFVAKSGFNFGDDLRLILDLKNNTAQIQIPSAKVLSCEMTGYRVIEDKAGYWNRISKEDRERVVDRLLRSSRILIEETGINQDAEKTLRQRVNEVLQSDGYEITDHTS